MGDLSKLNFCNYYGDGVGLMNLNKIMLVDPLMVHKIQPSVTVSELDKLPRNSADFQADSIGSESLSSPFWVSSTIPGDWMWQLSSQFDGLSDQNIKRQIVCELEGDATVDGLYGIPV
ncbi:hypothetical protein Q3G72_015010 [Acer saccharum]|nr:hypothetical protein Q3G72_015010 [Acer saccharum]